MIRGVTDERDEPSAPEGAKTAEHPVLADQAPADLPYDAILLVSFGGPENRADVMPFLENVVRGKRVPKERLLAVAEHYYALDGVSPINAQCRALIEALEEAMAEKGPDLPIYWGNRNWNPMLADTLRQMRDDGIKRAVAIFTSAYSSYSGCRQYLENIEAARAEVGEGAPYVDKIRTYFNHPGFIEATVARTEAALNELPGQRRDGARIIFTAHSIPMVMAEHCDYEKQLHSVAQEVAERVDKSEFQLVYQSRSGPPEVPWLGPDVLEHIEALGFIGTSDVVVVPIGFISDHVEVIWDLDREAAEACEEQEIHMVRAATVGTHPAFVEGLRELVVERIEGVRGKPPCVGSLGPGHTDCPVGCCAYPVPVRRKRPATGEFAAAPEGEEPAGAKEAG
ncbi:MAG: ferrochelatase [Sandaracinus sp.]|nr:ferrochelatase [Sandaracinus sp.]|tara:strand:- start:5610 stop:6797 length:1188 start_codon:yes stop_codon:yes gene_type:complete